MASVFISHSWSDKELARRIAQVLREFSIKVWLDEAEIKIGDSLIEKIRKGIDSVDYVIALLSRKAVNSEWVKKELDIAMNQEIEGKKVKVLPILAEKCNLPGFLKGKLYADMSTSSRFTKALPLLLDVLGFDKSLLPDSFDAKVLDKYAKKSKTADELAAILKTKNLAIQYTKLKSLRFFEYKDCIHYPNILNSLVSTFNSEDIDTHLRVEALRVFGFSEDKNFAYLVDPLLKNDNVLIVKKAIKALIDLKANNYGHQLIEMLQTNSDASIQKAILNYFSKIAIDNDNEALTIVSKIIQMHDDNPEDLGLEMEVAQILCCQWNGNRDEILTSIINLNISDKPEINYLILNSFKDASAEERFFIRRHEIKDKFKLFLRKFANSENDSEKAIAWLVGLLWWDADKDEVWTEMAAASPKQIFTFFEELEFEGYNLEYIFREEDIIHIDKLIEKSDEELRLKILESLPEIHTKEALEVLIKYKHIPSERSVTHILKCFALLTKWKNNYKHYFKNVVSKSSEEPRDQLYVAIGKYNSGEFTLKEMLAKIPKKNLTRSWFSDHDIVTKLIKIKEKAQATEKRKLDKVISVLRKEME